MAVRTRDLLIVAVSFGAGVLAAALFAKRSNDFVFGEEVAMITTSDLRFDDYPAEAGCQKNIGGLMSGTPVLVRRSGPYFYINLPLQLSDRATGARRELPLKLLDEGKAESFKRATRQCR